MSTTEQMLDILKKKIYFKEIVITTVILVVLVLKG